ncbi:MAG: efflux RND transporter permease subunit [Hyphomicrobiales bacterium]|nr:efflux RND transporter permease subunit [Hyphomicrobiales bacterium]
MSTLFFRNKRIFALTLLMILAAGISALVTIGRQEDPTITNLFATIVTPYPGADPARVEALVTEKIEDELRKIAEIDEITSVSRSGISVIRVELSQFISDETIEQTWSEIRDALGDAARNFPAGVPEPDFDDDRTGAYTAISAIVPRAGTEASPAIVRRYAEILQDRLRGLSGTKLVRLFGAQQEEILVEIDPRKLTSLGLTAEQVSGAITRADAKVRAGQIRGAQSDLLIEISGEIKSLERIRNVPVTNDTGGRIVRVSDVATVERSVRKPAASLAYADGVPAVLVAARMEDDLQVDTWIARVKAVQTTFEKELPAGLEHRLLFDQSHYTADRLQGVLQNLMIGVSLVVAVLLLTLGWRAATVVASILPLASLISIAGLQAVGIPIHQMSVTGLIVALGLLVDAAIVMTDEIRKKLEAGAERHAAVGEAVQRLAVPLLASTVTTALAFMPMVLLPGPAGDFVGAIATAVIIMLTASFALALTIAPTLAGWLLRRPEPGKTVSWLAGGGVRSEVIGRVFGKSLDLALSFPRLAILGALILPVVGFGAFPTLKAQFFPGVDRDQFYLQIKLPDSTSIAETDRAARKAGKIVRAQTGIRNVHWVIGESAPAFYYNMIMDQDGEASFAEALITTQSAKTTEAILPELQRALDKALPQARVTVRGLVQGPPVNAPVEIRLVGPDLQVLRRLGEKVRTLMVAVPDIVQAKTELTGGAPKLKLDLDEEKVRLAGLELGAVARQLETQLEGATGGSLIEGSEELPVRVRVGDQTRGVVDALRRTDVLGNNAARRAAEGAYPGVPLAALGTLRLVPAETPIFRLDGERVNTVQGYVHRNVLPEEALKKVQARIAESGLTLPPGYRLEVGGDSDARDEVLRNLLASMGLIVALTVATIVLTFNSFRLSLITATVAILSMGLSLLALAVFRYPFGIQAVIGVIGSIGVSINAAIIIMTALQQDARALVGNVRRIREIVLAQSRHIVSTTVTTFGGFLPLILEGGGFWPPFAMAIAGGVLLSTIVSFYFTPPAFLLVMRHGGKRSRAGRDRSLASETPKLHALPAAQAA